MPQPRRGDRAVNSAGCSNPVGPGLRASRAPKVRILPSPPTLRSGYRSGRTKAMDCVLWVTGSWQTDKCAGERCCGGRKNQSRRINVSLGKEDPGSIRPDFRPPRWGLCSSSPLGKGGNSEKRRCSVSIVSLNKERRSEASCILPKGARSDKG